jgi:hypothetical protein
MTFNTGGTSTTPPGADGSCTGISEASEPQVQPVDVIVAVDTSGSMDLEAQWTQNAMPSLAQTIAGSGIDTNVVMISSCDITVPPPLGSGSPCPDDTLAPKYLHLPVGIGSNDALQKFIETYPQWQPMLRPNSKKQFLVVTDDDSDMSAQDFINAINALDPVYFRPDNWVFHGVFAFADPYAFGSPCFFPIAAARGSVYFDLTIATLGFGGDLCTQQFDPIFAQLAQSVITSAELSCEWAIPPPENGEIDPELVNVIFTGQAGAKPLGYVPGPEACAGAVDAWYYDNNEAPTRVFACPTTCTELKSAGALSIEIQFGCARQPAIIM